MVTNRKANRISIFFKPLDDAPSTLVVPCPMVSIAVSMRNFEGDSIGENNFDWAALSRHAALIDTGAALSYVDSSMYDLSQLPVVTSGTTGTVFGGSAAVNYYKITVLFDGTTTVGTFLFGGIDLSQKNYSAILGMYALDMMHLRLGPGQSGYLKR